MSTQYGNESPQAAVEAEGPPPRTIAEWLACFVHDAEHGYAEAPRSWRRNLRSEAWDCYVALADAVDDVVRGVPLAVERLAFIVRVVLPEEGLGDPVDVTDWLRLPNSHKP